MEFTNEMLGKAKTAKTAEELLEMAKVENVEMTKEEAAKYFADMHKTGELSDEELDNVAGGCRDYYYLSSKGGASSPAEVQFLYWVSKYVEVFVLEQYNPSSKITASDEWTEAADIVDRKVERYDDYYYPKYKVRYRGSGSEKWVWQNQIQAGLRS